MNAIKISVAKDFTTTPGIRYKSQGAYSGEEFLEKILAPAYEKAESSSDTIVVDLDGTSGYASSFLEEVFGGLARKYKNKNILSKINIISEEEKYLVDEIKEYINKSFKN